METRKLSVGAKCALGLASVLSGTGSGFVIGAVLNVLSALPALAGGGHAVGGEHTNWIPIGAGVGAALGAVLAIAGLLFRSSER